jgi:hypothetical protein
MGDKYRRDGTPYPPGAEGLREWARDFGNDALKRVAKTELPNGLLVSTVWLGLDHSFGGQGPPLIFETMVFGGDAAVGEYQERYSTEQEALEGHQRAIEKFLGWTREGGQ